MGEWDRCINDNIQSGKITKAVGKALLESSDPLTEINGMQALAKRAKRDAAIQAVRIADGWDKAIKHPEGPETGLMSLLVKDTTGKSGYANIAMRQSYYQNRYHSKLADFLFKFKSKVSGLNIVHDEKALESFIYARYGNTEGIDPEIVSLSKTYGEVVEMARQDFNRMGGSISKNDAYLIPQNHDAPTISKYGKEEWMADVDKWNDPLMMTDDLGLPLTPEGLRDGVDYSYDSITTYGLNKAKDFTAPVGQGKKMARKGSEKRFLYFKDAESWIAYQNKYGKGNIYQTLLSNINMLANDSATMEIMGTNPRATFDALMGMVEKDRVANNRPITGINWTTTKGTLEAVFKVTSGTIEQGMHTTLADMGQAVRNIITASFLGKAVISSISDEAFGAITANYNNLSPMSQLSKKGKILLGDKEMQLTAVRIGLGADSWVNAVNAGNRYGDIYGVGKTAKAAEWVIRVSGLERLTDAGRKAFGLEYSGYLATNFHLPFDEMNVKTLKQFDAYGITEEIWDQFRKSKTFDHQGAKYADMTQPGGDKFHQMIMSETDYAIPTPDARVRAMTTGGHGTGTVIGQLWRSATNLKSFPITLMTTHFYRMMHQATLADRTAYGAMVLASTTLLGAVALQAKDFVSGREPRDMSSDPEAALKFWGAAMMQGGGLGIFGDYLFSDVNRFGSGLSATALGPTGQLIDTTYKLTVGNLQQAFKGEDTNWDTEAIRYIERYTPSVWQIQPLKAAAFDQIQLLLDPKVQKKMNQARKKRMKEYGQDYWWRRGEVLPEAMQ